jgi:hypothetical protein
VSVKLDAVILHTKNARHVIQARTVGELRRAVEQLAGKGARIKRVQK